MDQELIERLAGEAGFDISDVERLGCIFPPPDDGIRSEGLQEPLRRFAALIVEKCAKACEDMELYREYDPGESCAAVVRAKFKGPT